ncbi:MAG: hypothetical protein ACON4U_21895 [Myxococcota bacterium]
MFRIPPDFVAQIEKTVEMAEQETHAEIVVVLAHRSGPYWSTALATSIALAYLFLLVALFSHIEVSPLVLVIELPLLMTAVAYGAYHSSSLMRQLTPKSRQHKQVKTAAHAAFYEESVGGTKNRTGVLVYLSILENRVAVVADRGVLGTIPEGELEAIRWSPDAINPHTLGQLPDVLSGLSELGALCKTHLPNVGATDNEIPNTPVVRPW